MLIGLIDNDHKAVTWDLIQQGIGNFDDPPALLSLFYSDEHRKMADNEWSITELMNDPLQVQLKRRNDYFVEIETLHDALMGSAVHAYLASRARDEKAIVEKTFNLKGEVDGQEVTIFGTPDYVDVENAVLWDYKTVTIASVSRIISDKKKHAKYADQVNGYKWLLHHNGIVVNSAMVRFWARDWRKWEAAKSQKTYNRSYTLPIRTDTIEKIEKRFEGFISTHLKAQTVDITSLPECDTWDGKRCSDYCAVCTSCPFRG